MFSDRLKYLRSTEDLTQRDLAFKLGITSGAVGMYESGKRFPDNTILNKIADYFHVSTDYLLGRTDDPLPVRNVDQDLLNDQSEDFFADPDYWEKFLDSLPVDQLMAYQNVDFTEEEKRTAIELHWEHESKRKEKVMKLMDYPESIIDEALRFAAYQNDQRKKSNEN